MIVRVISRLIAIRIHIWGGLGSQLNGLHVALRLQEKFPQRRLVLIFHTSGVTRRPLELDPIDIPFQTAQIDDFVENNHRVMGTSTFSPVARKVIVLLQQLLKKTLAWLGFLAFANNDLEFERLPNCLLTLRGHYSDLNVSQSNAIKLWGLLFDEPLQNILPGKFSLHLRLGDLLSLDNKGPIEKIRVTECLNQVVSQFNVSEFSVFSEGSQAEVDCLLNTSNFSIPFSLIMNDTRELILECAVSEVFVGTNSKVSLWVARFRSSMLGQALSFLPVEFSKLFPEPQNSNIYY